MLLSVDPEEKDISGVQEIEAQDPILNNRKVTYEDGFSRGKAKEGFLAALGMTAWLRVG